VRIHTTFAWWLIFVAAAGPVGAQKLKIDVPIKELEERAQRDSNDATAHYNLALGYWSKRKWDDADAQLKRAVELDPRFAPAALAMAYLPLANERGGRIEWRPMGGGNWWVRFVAEDSVIQRFDNFYRKAFTLDPLVDIRIAVAAEYRDGSHVDNYDRALYAYNDGKWDEAYRRFGEMVPDSNDYRSYPQRYERVLWYHGLAASRVGKHDDAIRDMQWLVDRSQRREASDTMFRVPLRTNEYRYVLAFVKQRAGDLNGAVAGYQDAITNDLGLFPAHIRIAEIYEGSRQWTQAIAARRHAIDASPDDPSLQLDLGWTLVKAGQFAEAETELSEAVRRAPRDARAPYYLALVQQQLGKTADAKQSFQRFIAIAPSRYERQIADARTRLATLR
jgi:tetratricopeptide (TPR) repeat protein